MHRVAQAGKDQDERVETRIHARRVDAEGGVRFLFRQIENDAVGPDGGGGRELLERSAHIAGRPARPWHRFRHR